MATRVPLPANLPPKTVSATRLRAANRRTAFTLAAIATMFFLGIIGSRFMGGSTGIGIMGAGVLLYLGVAIGRNLRDKR